MPSPSIDNLRCFVQAARLLNFRAAAKAVALTPAAFGQRIKQLEDQLGTRLFQRDTHRMSLTEGGLSLLPSAVKALEAIEDCVRATAGGVAPPLELVVGTRHELGLSWVLPMLPSMRTLHPHLHFHVYFGSSEDLLIRVRTLEVDCAVGSMRLDDPRLEGIALHAERYVFVGSPTLLKTLPLRSPADARQHTLIDTGPDVPLYRYFGEAPRSPGTLEFDHLVRIGTIEGMRMVVLRGEGVAVLPEYLIRGDLERRKLARVFPRVPLLSGYFRLIFRKDDTRRSIFEALARSMRGVPLS